MQPGASNDQPEVAPKKRIRESTPNVDHCPESVGDDDAETPKPKRRAKTTAHRTGRSSVSTESGRKHDANDVPVSLQEALSELNRPETTSERKDALLESISSVKCLRKYSDRSLLLKRLVQHEIDYSLLNVHPVLDSVSRFFQRLFASMHLTSSSKTRALEVLFEQINECLSDGKDQIAELSKVLRGNAASIASHGGYLVFMLRLAALRQLERNGFDAFDTLCYLIEALRQCVATDIATTIRLIADEERFTDAVKTTQAAQVQLALSMSKYGLALPNSS